ncbi:tetratricopeptide repeat protein [Fusobacterium sp. PH5-44]|uniref:tetratricopeptide repeat protein n=1 Tax=unclassified Fusobacterium TaxID=2648384 RepID=UPI003D1B3BBF
MTKLFISILLIISLNSLATETMVVSPSLKINLENFSKEEFIKRADEGDIEKQYELAMIYAEENKYILAENYWKLAADAGHVKSQNILGNFYINQQKLDLALKYFKMSADAGNADAQFRIGLYNNENKKLKEAEKYFKLSANQGHTDAQVELGLLYYSKKNYNLAEKYWKLAADANNIVGMNNLGVVYSIKKKDAEAIQCWEKAAEQGYMESQFILGTLYKDKLNLEKAEEYLNLAAKQGHKKAKEELDKINQMKGSLTGSENSVTPKNIPHIENKNSEKKSNYLLLVFIFIPVIAIGIKRKNSLLEKKLEINAEKGVVSVQMKLGNYYEERGQYDKAIKYYTMAAERGYMRGKEAVERLRKV